MRMIRLLPPAFMACGLAWACAPAAAQSPVPAPTVTYVPRQDLEVALKAAVAQHNDPALATIGVTDRYAIHEVHRGHGGPPAVHPGATELHFILAGSATFVTGGRIIPPAGPGGTPVIEGGATRTVHQGDAIIVPPDTPHWYQHVDRSVTYLEVRFATPASAPASK
jgi:mannose-6-phosphate isomerase-like protein (cupin superfamily)